MTDLVVLMRQHSLSAMDRFGAISPQLRGLMSKTPTRSFAVTSTSFSSLTAAEALEAS